MAVLGVHDGHDNGAALAESGTVSSAINEERFTKLKNDVGFPVNSIKYIVKAAGDAEIDKIAIARIDGAAIFTRLFPALDVQRRKLFRHEIPKPSAINLHMSNMIFKLTQEQRPKWLWSRLGKGIGAYAIGARLRKMGLGDKIVFVEHHLAHASSAYYASGFNEALVITLDASGDGICGSVSIGDRGELTRINEFRAGASLGILYGAATVACDMRFSEDEGKLMSLAAYSFPSEIKELKEFSYYDESKKELVSSSGIKYEFLLAEHMKNALLWKYGREAFAYSVQRYVETQVLKIVRQYIKETNIHNVAVAGGLFSNIIINMLINELPEVSKFFVFPHVGDGGLALGAAYYTDFKENGKFNSRQINNLYYGPEYSDSDIEDALEKYRKAKKIDYEEVSDIASYTADKMIDENEAVLWFQGRMEYGPRALGNRSVLAMPNINESRDRINLMIKKRPYYQPFASTILEEDAGKLLDPCVGKNRFMTVGYTVKESRRGDLIAASHIDGTTRPQMLGEENMMFRDLIKKVKKENGIGALLNTSLNKHGRPIVMDPEDAIWTLLNTGATSLSIGNFFVKKRTKA
ncbi:MAG: carbamoyltransferase C-terminal domain-containing protein [Candidatus Micrarchaeaceae archaeon]